MSATPPTWTADTTLFDDVVAVLRSGGCADPAEECQLIIEHVCEVSPGCSLVEAQCTALALAERRIAGDRLEYLLGWTWFAGVRIEVDYGVFIPRWQTETLATLAAATALSLGSPTVLDLFCGTAAIACVVADRVPTATVLAGERDPRAVACARRNAVRFGIDVYESDVDAGIPVRYRGEVDVLTANVPYVPAPEMHRFAREWALEPPSTRHGGDDGLAWTRIAATRAASWLREGGWFFTEIGVDQEQDARRALEEAGFSDVRVCDDPDGDPCAVMGQLSTTQWT